MDEQQPAAAMPPQQPTGIETPDYAALTRPTGVTLAAIYLIVMGMLFALSGFACGTVGLFVSGPGTQAGGIFTVVGGLVSVIGIMLLVMGILSVIGGAAALMGRSWGRWLALVMSLLFVVLGVLFGLGGAMVMVADASSLSWIGFWIVTTVAYALCAVAFARSSAYFSYGR